MIFLGIDAATKTGWAIFDTKAGDNGGKITESGVMDFSKKRGESNGMMFIRFRKWLNDILLYLLDFELYVLDFESSLAVQEYRSVEEIVVVYEQAHFRGGAATEVCVGLQTRVQEVAESMGVSYSTVKTTTLKKFATGKGNAGKEEMMAASEDWLGRPPIDDNEADAVHIARWGAEEYGGAT